MHESTLNQASRWRLELARRIAPVYSAYPDVRAVILGGSAALGYADRYSDIEIGVFWQRPPAEAERRRAAQQAGGEQLTLDAYDTTRDEGIEDYFIQQANIDVVHRTIDGTGQIISDVVDRQDTSLAKQTLIHALRHAIPLMDSPLPAQWRRRTDEYPDALVHTVVARQLSFKPWWSVEALAERQSLVLVQQALCIAIERVLAALLAMNRQYHPGLKWLPQLVQGLTIAPDDLAQRIRHCFHADLSDRVRLAAVLVEDTFDLAALHVPDLDLAARRDTFRRRRQPIEAAPPDIDVRSGAV